MKNKRSTYHFLLLLSAFFFFSCSQEEPQGVGAEGSEIVFRVSMSDPDGRSTDTTVGTDLSDNGFQVSAFCPEANVTGTLDPYFNDRPAKLLEEKPGFFGIFDPTSDLYGWPSNRHSKEGRLKFFAFYPSIEAMKQTSGAVDAESFKLVNSSTKQGTVNYDYRISKFKVHTDITRHIDFVTATTEGTKLANKETGVRLDFEHQLCRIALTAWGNTTNDIEIAGIRIGSVVVESDFNFTATPTHLAQGDNTVNGNWVGSQTRDCLEYIFREGDTVVKIGNGSHTSDATAASIMGSGGWAMVIPSDTNGWNHTKDETNKMKGLFFSVLLRVKEGDGNNSLVYPYVIGEFLSTTISSDAMDVIYMAVEKATGKVMKRLYRNDEDQKYYIGSDFTDEYSLPSTEEIRNYGWAAVPLAPTTTYRWKPGYQYTYALNYTEGVGVHAPDAPLPGKPILSKILVGVGVSEDKKPWHTVSNFIDSNVSVGVSDVIIQ